MKTATKVMAVVAVAFLAMSGEALAAKRAKTKLQMTGQLNLNTATQAQLDQLPGVGEKAAKRIIEHRTKTPFTKVEELTKVKGFGKKKLEKLKGISEDQSWGVKIVRHALEAPLRTISSNAGAEPAVVVNRVRSEKGAFGYNAATGEYEDLMKAGVIDPVKVVRTALQNAASIAGLMLTTEAVISEKPKEEKAHSHGPGGMGGMM